MAHLDDDSLSEARFGSYVERVADVLSHADRKTPFRLYCSGLLKSGGRKSVEAIASSLAPLQSQRLHQSLHHFVANADWSDEALLARVREVVLHDLTSGFDVETWIVSEMGFVKKGMHSVGVARQGLGESGKIDNRQVAISLAVADPTAMLPIAFRLYLPEEWAADAVRRARAVVPRDIVYQGKPDIALDLIRAARADGAPQGVVLADASFGRNEAFRASLWERALDYIVGVWPSLSVADAGLAHRGTEPQFLPAEQLANSIPPETWRDVAWREGSETVDSRFAALRVHPHRGEGWRPSLPNEEWLLIERRFRAKTPTAYWLSNLPIATPIARLVGLAKQREWAERVGRWLREDFGLDHYEGRSWRGFHHHAALCIAAYGFLLSERFALHRPLRFDLGGARRTPRGRGD